MTNNYELSVLHENTMYWPIVLNEVKVTWERSGTPGKLTFTYYDDGNCPAAEGDSVSFKYKDQNVFFGYIFKMSRSETNEVSVTVYDQLRYFKNKFTYVFTDKTATEILQAVASDYGVNVGSAEDTGYKIQSLIEENISAFDIVLDALDETLANTGNLFILYDNFGSVELKSLDSMTLDLLLDEDTIQGYDYSTSIDDETYNKIVLYYVDEETNDRVPFVAENSSHVDQWGLLQYFEEVKVKSIGQSKADALLKLYDQRTKSLTIRGAFGDTRVRGGSLILAKFKIGTTQVENYLLVEKVEHTFKNDLYTMDITVNGAFGGD